MSIMVSSALKRYRLALNRYKWPCLGSFLSVVGLSTVVALQPPPPPQYRAESLLVQTLPPQALAADESSTPPSPQRVASENSLLSDQLLQRVSEDLGAIAIAIDPKTLPDHTDVKLENDADQGQQVTVTFTWPDFDQAQVILDVMVRAMVDLSLEANQAQLQTIIEALERQLPAVETTLLAAKDALETYDREKGLTIQAAQDGRLLEAIAAGQEQQRQNNIALAAVDSQIQSLEQQLGLSPQEALTASALSADPVIAQLRSQILEAETQLKLLSPNLRETHPTVQDLTTSLVAYNDLLEKRAGEVIGGNGLVAFSNVDQIRQKSALDPARADLASQLVALNNEREAILRQNEVLAQSTAQLTGEYSQTPNLQLERARQVQRLELNRALYDQIQAKRIDAQTAKAETLSSLAIAEPPVTTVVPQMDLSPRLVIAVGSLGGLILAGTLAQLLNTLDGTIRTDDELQDILSNRAIKVLSTIPALKRSANQILPLILQPNSPYQGLRDEVKQAVGQPATSNGAVVILITSVGDGEGKTTTAFNLGIASARAGRQTLIVEVDLHHASYSDLLGVQRPTVTDAQQYYSGEQADLAQPVPQIDNLYIVPSPGPQSNTAAVLESSELAKFLSAARDRYDLVILDTPSLTISSNDAVMLGSATDGLLLVTRPGHIQKIELITGLEKLQHRNDLKLLGAVINGADG
ncbi:cobalamin biosynthesis protein CobQ [filamentous cyanobacterium CCT1]|nr:cobalamin biosynthesis protein CobQ [filamentous cyanobacterium CCT1]PSN76090.1 cobalamin biosynthesis protein CobQ [filamentous cyanobacterium CCP4]